MQCGIHEFLLKPVSSKSLADRLTAVLNDSRKLVRKGEYYGPEPRKPRPINPDDSLVMLN
jgi:YesN/AraC family two-component response regulator